MKVIGNFLVVTQVFSDTTEEKQALVNIDDIQLISEGQDEKGTHGYIYCSQRPPIVVKESVEEITNTLENEYFTEEY